MRFEISLRTTRGNEGYGRKKRERRGEERKKVPVLMGTGGKRGKRKGEERGKSGEGQ